MFPFVHESFDENLIKLTSTAFTISIEINGGIDYSIFQIPNK